jgi:hypothetical protein
MRTVLKIASILMGVAVMGGFAWVAWLLVEQWRLDR